MDKDCFLNIKDKLTSERESFYAAFCLNIMYLTKFQAMEIKPTVLSLYYQRSSLHKWRYGKKQMITLLDMFSKNGHSHSEQAPPISKHWQKTASNNKLSQNNEKFKSNLTGERIRTIKWTASSYFLSKTYRYVRRTNKDKTTRNTLI